MVITKEEKIAATEKFNRRIAELKAQGKMWCSLCDKVKPLAEFDDDSNHYCRACLTGITLATAEERDEREE